MRKPKQRHGLQLESLESRMVLQGVGIGNPFDGIPEPPFETPPVEAPPTNGRPVIVHPLGGPGRPDSTPPDPQVPPFGEQAPSAIVVRSTRAAAMNASAGARTSRVRTIVDPAVVDLAHSQTPDGSALSATRASTVRRAQSR